MHHKFISFKSYPLAKSLAVSLTLSFFMATTAQAAIQYPLNELKVIEVPISKQGLTRITVKEDRILNVFGITGEYVLEADEDQGQIFIRPSELGNNKPINLTLTTEGGHTQDLRLIPKDQAPEALILKAETSIQKELSRVYSPSLKEKLSQTPIMRDDITCDDITRDEVEDLIHACRDGRISLGYKAMPLNIKTSTEPYPLVRELRGEKLRCLTYKIRNITKAPLILSEREFATSLSLKIPNIIAILMPTKTLNSGERTHVHVVATAPY